MEELTENEIKTLSNLRKNKEGAARIDSEGNRWYRVYLPNIGDSKSFVGTLASLKKKGLYRPQGDHVFGDVAD